MSNLSFIICPFTVINSCPEITCMDCPEGYRAEEPHKDEAGCYVSSCTCIPEFFKEPADPCPIISCPLGRIGECEMVDGCKICKCLPMIHDILPQGCEEQTKDACLLYCPLGYENDLNGCPICKCKSDCLMHACDSTCHNGYQVDSTGCPTCKCNPSVSECIDIECNLSCPYGFETDEDGCEMCSCNYHKIMQYGDPVRGKRRG